jgi:hypothetical protein
MGFAAAKFRGAAPLNFSILDIASSALSQYFPLRLNRYF